MAYNDPYYSREHQTYGGHQGYSDGPEFDPYNQHQRHPTYDQSGYSDDYGYGGATARQADFSDPPSPPRPNEKNRYDSAAFPSTGATGPNGSFGRWRKDHYGNMWIKGSRGKCILRFTCCTFLLFIFFLASIILTLGIYIRPPDVNINTVGLNSTGGSPFSVTSSTLTLDLGIGIAVDNPNFFDVDFKSIKVDLSYPINELPLGGGEKDNVKFKSHTQTSFDFPFSLTYKIADDTNLVVLKDLLSKCGMTGTKQNIDIDYEVILGLKILFFTVSPSFSSSFSFACPFSESDISALLAGAGIDLGSVTSALATRETGLP